ncbi:MAG: DUF2071 domain-containing protein [Chloroflexi bacterium]|nr:DUF2071 domain-containing protein [Chloroflexota bacterium]
MRAPVIRGVIDRRILVNYRVDPDVLSRFLPAPFRPRITHGVGMAGICLIRLKEIRPAGFPAVLGLTSENAAHRIAVEWDEGGEPRQGVYIPRRDTDSCLNTLAGGRIFPGVHHHATFRTRETADRLEVQLESNDGKTRVAVSGRVDSTLPSGSIFESPAEASGFFEAGSVGYSATAAPSRFEGMELRCFNWSVQPLAVESVTSSFFEESSAFPPGSVEFDCALLMRGIHHQWAGKPDLCCSNPERT